MAVANDTNNNGGDDYDGHGGHNRNNKVQVGEEVHYVRLGVVHVVAGFTQFSGRGEAT